jgi:hypothetical protein
MVVGEVISDLSNLQLDINSLVTIFRIIGGLFGLYVVFWVVNLFINWKKNRFLKDILENVEEINKKLEKRNKK